MDVKQYMEKVRNAIGTKLVDGHNLYSGYDGHVRFAHEVGYALNDFDASDRQTFLKGSYSCVYVRACFLKPILDAKEWISLMESQVMRRVDAVKIIERLMVKQPEFVDGLYRAFDLMNISETDHVDSFYKNKYVRKWLDIEQAFRRHNIDVNPKDYPKGISVNLELIKEYLDLEFQLPFN